MFEARGSVFTMDRRSKSTQASVDVLIAAVDLVDVADAAGAFGRHCGEQHGYAGSDVGAEHIVGAKGEAVVKTDHYSSVWIAEHDLGTHVDEIVDKEEAAFKHLLVDQHRTAALGGGDEHHAQEVGGESGPGRVGHMEYRTVEIALDLVALLLGDIDIVATALQPYAEALESVGDDAELVVGGVFDGDRTAGYSGHAYEAAHLDHVGQDAVGASVEELSSGAVDAEQIGAEALDHHPHGAEHPAKLLDIRLACGIVDGGDTASGRCGHDDIGRAGDRGFVEQHITSLEAGRRSGEHIGVSPVIIVHLGSQREKSGYVGVDFPAPYLIATRLGEEGSAEAGEHWSGEEHASAQLGRAGHKFGRLGIVEVNIVGFECVDSLYRVAYLNAEPTEQVDEIVDIENLRYVGQGDLLACEENGRNHFERFVFRALRVDVAVEFVSSFYVESAHMGKALGCEWWWGEWRIGW